MTEQLTTMADFTRALTGTRDAPTLTFRREYATDAADLWDAVTTPERLARWMGRVEGDVSGVGDRGRVVMSAEADDVADIEIRACDAPRALTLTWSWQGERSSIIEAMIDEASTGAVLTLTHRLAEPAHLRGYGGGWEDVLTTLGGLFGGATPTADVEANGVAVWENLDARAMELQVELAAPVERVWDAIATPAGLASWWWTHWDDTTVTADVRVGGTYRFAAASAGVAVEGEFVTVQAPHVLGFTWRWIDADGVTTDEACEMRLEPAADGTTLTVRHTGPWTDDSAASDYRAGWTFTLGQLATVVAG